ncbi:hypothetical protein [Paludisphaera sp.]|uniref:lipoate--protein ligase family protein n=1 Tax=Paludisphaera sp. TaxID=2017432 RepID=UPI00301B9964
MLCRVLPYRVAPGPTNMAIDEAMLGRVARDPSAAWLRTYGWSEPTLSLGYFQPWAETDREPRWRSAAKVRRATGGGAIWHEHELTFAIVIPSSHPLARPNTALYRAVHRATAELLATAGAPARRRQQELRLRLHHRSGVFGLIAPKKSGSNFIGVGIRIDLR